MGNEMDKMDNRELISALADGQLQGDALAQGIAAATAGAQATEAWHTYHVIGDVLRSSELAGATPAQEFLARLQESLRAETRPAGEIRPIETLPARAAADVRAPAANDSQRWKLVAGFASLAAVAAIGWTVMGGAGEKPGAQLAATPAVMPASGTVLTGTDRGTMIRDERLDKLLAAHRGATALQSPSGFLRNATFEGPAR